MSRLSRSELILPGLTLAALIGGAGLLLHRIWLVAPGSDPLNNRMLGAASLIFFLGLLVGSALLFRRLSSASAKEKLPLWLGVALVLTLAFVAWTLSLLRTASRLQGEVADHAGVVSRLHALEETIHSLQASFAREGSERASSQWDQLQEDFRRQIAALAPEDLPRLEIQSHRIEAMTAVARMDQHRLVMRGLRAGSAEREAEGEQARAEARQALNQVREAVRHLRANLSTLSLELAKHWRWMNSLALISGVLGVGAVLLLGLYHRNLTQQRRVEENLRHAYQLQEEAEAISHLGSFEWDVVRNRVNWSDELHRIYGLQPGEFRATLEAFLYQVHPDDRERVQRTIETACREGGAFRLEKRILRADGETRILDGQGRVTLDENGKPVRIAGVCLDVTVQKQAEEQLRASLREKDALLKEVHHRVKNNLQIVISLISLQSLRIKDPAILGAFDETEDRIRSMGLLHEMLYRSEDLNKINVRQYVESLCTRLFRSYGIDGGRIELHTDVAEMVLDLDRAIPCGLIIHELVSNALKHAFANERPGQMRIRFYPRDAHQYVLIVEDDGVGLPDDFDLSRADSLGLQLVRDLGEQLHATMTLDRQAGTRFTIEFACEPGLSRNQAVSG